MSYFLRASKMYDTLLQMGRWFGYRPEFLDLCRLYTTSDLHEWFEHITEAGEELRDEFDVMAASGATPREIRTEGPIALRPHGDVEAERVFPKTRCFSFSGQLMETVSL